VTLAVNRSEGSPVAAIVVMALMVAIKLPGCSGLWPHPDLRGIG
jgi:hypothetical protein